MNIIAWLRKFTTWSRTIKYTKLEQDHYKKFEAALEVADIEVMIYEHGIPLTRILLQGEDLHPVTISNLLQFRKLNRKERRNKNISKWKSEKHLTEDVSV